MFTQWKFVKMKPMKKLLFVILAVSFMMVSAARGKDNKSDNSSEKSAVVALSGIVTDKESGESLAGVEVKLDGTEIKTYTDFDGRFTFKNIKPGEYRIITSYISYEKREVTISETSQKDSQVSIKLKPSV